MSGPVQHRREDARLQDLVALVTGAGSRGDRVGIGSAIALSYAAAGAKVCLVDLDPNRLAETMARIDVSADVILVVGDVTDAGDCRRVVSATVDAFGQLDVLVNNVGMTDPRPVESIDEDTWDKVLAVNLKSVMLMSRAAIPHLRESRAGTIVNIASIAGLLARGGSAYGASKAGVIMLTREMAVAYGRDGIRANAIAPGYIHGSFVDAVPDEQRTRRRKVAPLDLEGSPWDVAHAAVFLASREARFVTGAVLPVDGGVTALQPLHAFNLIND